MHKFMMDLRLAVRLLIKKPAFTAVALTALALGIGANAAIFSVINAVLLRPLPYPEADRIHWVWEVKLGEAEKREPVSMPHFEDWKRLSGSFEHLAAYAFDNFNLTGAEQPQQVRAARVSEEFFEVLGVSPQLGTVFEENENGRVGVLTHRLWTRQYGGDRNVVGQAIQLDGQNWTVVGVMPPDFNIPDGWDLWIPMERSTGRQERDERTLWVIGKLKPEVSPAGAQREMDAIAARLAEEHPDTDAGFGVRLASLHDDLVKDVRLTLWVLLGAVGLVLLIACANIANLLLARSQERERELGVRLAMGASRFQIVRQLLTESVVLGLVGGLVGLGAALWALDALLALAPAGIPRIDEVALDWNVFAFTLLAAIGTGLLFGLAPAVQCGSADLAGALSAGGRGGTLSAARSRTRGLLVATEVALALTLAAAAGLMLRSFLNLNSVEPGFAANVLTVGLVLPPNEFPQGSQRIAFFEQALEGIESLPGVARAGAGNFLPTQGQNFPVAVELPRRGEGQEDENTFNQRVVTPGYFETLRIPLREGRVFDRSDAPDAPRAAIVNQEAARRYWAGRSPLGDAVYMKGYDGRPVELQVVGVVGDVRHWGLNSDPAPELYLAYAQSPWGYMNFVVRARQGDAIDLVGPVRRKIWDIDPRRPLFAESTLQRNLDRQSLAAPRFRAFLLTVFAVMAGLLAAVGVYGVISYSVSGRTREIGTRMALGADRGDVLKLILKQGLWMAGIGLLAGMGAAIGLSRLLTSILFGVSPLDPIAFAVAAAVLALVACAACLAPAWRAAGIDPAEALRRE